MMHSRWLLRIRTALRSIGLLSAVRAVTTWPARRRHKARMAEYGATRPDVIDLPGTPVPVRFHPFDAAHYADLMTPREPAVLRAIGQVVRPGSVVWEVGSNVGYFTVILAKLVGPTGQVVAFEPDPASRTQLLTNLGLNQLDTVRTYPFALGEQSGEFRLRSDPNPTAGIHKVEPAGAGIPVQVRRGDDVRVQDALPVPAVLKIDVEGAELHVLRGLWGTLQRPECRAVVVEVHFAILARAGEPDTPIVICDFLKEHGFTRLKWVDASHLVATK